MKPEIEAFDSGHLWYARQLVEEGLVEPPPFWVQLCQKDPLGRAGRSALVPGAGHQRATRTGCSPPSR